MKLFIHGVEKKQFNAEKFLVEDDQILVASPELAAYINGLQDQIAELTAKPEEAPAPPAAPAAPVFEIVEAENLPHTIKAFKAIGWTEEQLIDAGHLIKREVKAAANEVPAAPGNVPAAPDETPAPPQKTVIAGQFELDGVTYMMTPKAAAATHSQFLDNGWEIGVLVSEGYAKIISGGNETPAAPTEEKTFPFMNAEGDWEDSAGTIWTEAYSMGSNKIPPVTVKGTFKKSRAKAKTAAPTTETHATEKGLREVPAAPGKSNVPAAPGGVPAAPGAANASEASKAATIGDDDEPLDDELNNIVKNW